MIFLIKGNTKKPQIPGAFLITNLKSNLILTGHPLTVFSFLG
jgi:hypothetical protein